MKNYCLIIIMFLLTLMTLCLAGCADCRGNSQKIEHEVEFFIDNEKCFTKICKFGEKIQPPELEERSGYVFKGWYLDEDYLEKWDFDNNAVKQSMSLFGYWTLVENETFNVIFYDGDEILKVERVLKGLTVPEFVSQKEGYTFLNWYEGENIFDFSTPVTDDINLTAKWEIIDYTVKFIVGDVTIGEYKVNVENKTVTPPEIPEKQHYKGEWPEFEFNFEDAEVNAVFTPINYTVTFKSDGAVVTELSYTVEDEINFPDVPAKYGYTGSWEDLSVLGGDITISAEYTPIVYTIKYIIDNELYKEIEYTVETEEIKPPDIPEKSGYEGKWDDVEIVGNVNIQAIYTAINYKATFIVDEIIVSVCEFNIENYDITIPPVPDKAGYTGKWENFELLFEDVEINAIYTPVQFKAIFKVDGEEIGFEYFTIEDTAIESLPAIHEKQGYYAEWEDYTLDCSDIEINAVYTPITYYVTFVSDNKVVEKVPYTISDTKIEEPAPPVKPGYDVYWNLYSLTYEDIVVEAVSVIIDSNIEYTLKDDNTYEVTKYNNDASPAQVVIPYKHNGHVVTSIKSEAFAFTKLSAINLPDSITEIGGYAFAYTLIQTATLPKDLTEIAQNLFYGCENLENAILNDNLITINTSAFLYCKALTSIDLPKSVTTISANAFKGCESLESIKLANPSEWIFYDNSNNPLTNFDYSSLGDEKIAANLLTDTYNEYTLKRQ